MTAARKLRDEDQPTPAAQQTDEEGVVLSPEEEERFDRMIAEAEEDERAGRFVSVEEVRAKLRAA